jgi:hypothetical protein
MAREGEYQMIQQSQQFVKERNTDKNQRESTTYFEN